MVHLCTTRASTEIHKPFVSEQSRFFIVELFFFLLYPSSDWLAGFQCITQAKTEKDIHVDFFIYMIQ